MSGADDRAQRAALSALASDPLARPVVVRVLRDLGDGHGVVHWASPPLPELHVVGRMVAAGLVDVDVDANRDGCTLRLLPDGLAVLSRLDDGVAHEVH